MSIHKKIHDARVRLTTGISSSGCWIVHFQQKEISFHFVLTNSPHHAQPSARFGGLFYAY